MAEPRSCYVWNNEDTSETQRQAKRSRSLLARRTAFTEVWKLKKSDIELAKETALAGPLQQLKDFFLFDRTDRALNGDVGSVCEPFVDQNRIRTAVIRGGPGTLISVKQGLRGATPDRVVFADLDTLGTSNLRTCLKALVNGIVDFWIQEGGSQTDIDPFLQRFTSLDYDLQPLHDFCIAKHTKSVIVTISDSEIFDPSLLSDLVMFMQSWLDRIPFSLLIGVSLSEDVLAERLPSSILRLLDMKRFEPPRSVELVEDLFKISLDPGPDDSTDLTLRANTVKQARKNFLSPFIGPRLLEEMLQRIDDDLDQGFGSFEMDLKLAFFYKYTSDPLSVFLFQEGPSVMLDQDGFQRLRALPSFRKMNRGPMTGKVSDLHNVMVSDPQTLSNVAEQVRSGYDQVLWLCGALQVLEQLSALVHNQVTTLTYSKMYIKALKGELKDSTSFREAMLHMKRMDSLSLESLLHLTIDVLFRMPASAGDISPDSFADAAEELKNLVQDPDNPHRPLQISITSVPEPSTPIRNQRFGSRKRQSTQSQKQEEYSKLVDRVHEMLKSYLIKALVSTQEIAFHEILFYDQRIPHRDALNPRPRFVLERALSAPQDYLDCRCCPDNTNNAVATHHSVAILYQLYLESGSLINVQDLWSAYKAVLKGPSLIDEEDESDNGTISQAMALFMRSLADLRMLGLVKPSKRKPDHIAKLAWKGL